MRSDVVSFTIVRIPLTDVVDRAEVRALVRAWAQECGERVRVRRVELGVDRRRLATSVSSTEATIHRIETGFINPRDDLRFTIAAVLGTEIADLWAYPTCRRLHDELQTGR
jgi:DNA-binding XRE family transcriptional regulator